MKKTIRIARGAARVSLLLSGALGFVGSSYANEGAVTVEKFELQIFQETLASHDIIAGDFASAIEKNRVVTAPGQKYMANTNLCVSYTAQGKFSAAEEHCQEAKRLSVYRSQASSPLHSTGKEREALALNNLGVLHALQGRTQEAFEFFADASSKSRHFRATSRRNIDALEDRTEFNIATPS